MPGLADDNNITEKDQDLRYSGPRVFRQGVAAPSQYPLQDVPHRRRVPDATLDERCARPRAALYMRVSTGRQAENDLSIPDQRSQLNSWCRAHGYEAAAEFIESWCVRWR